MKSLMLLFAAAVISSNALSQNSPDTLGNIYDDLYQKKEGTIYLNNGRKVMGYVDYSTFTNILRVTSNETLPNPLTPGNVVRMEYFDASLQRDRTFVSWEFGLPEYKIDRSVGFFEILRSDGHLQLVSRSFPVQLTQKRGTPGRGTSGGPGRAYGTSDTDYRQTLITFTDQLEVVCFIEQNQILPYLAIKTREVENLSGHGLRNNSSRKHTRVVDPGLPKRIMGDKYKLVNKYASSKNLSWNNKDELALIVEHYLSLK